MTQPAHRPRYSLEEYLILEEMSTVRHEYLDGAIFATAGGTLEHGSICAHVISLLSSQLAGRRCRVFTSDVRVRVRATGLDTYPDLSVVCGQVERDDRDPQALSNPVVLVEVTSPSTEALSSPSPEPAAHVWRPSTASCRSRPSTAIRWRGPDRAT
jgi:Uma2 family endonuclease